MLCCVFLFSEKISIWESHILLLSFSEQIERIIEVEFAIAPLKIGVHHITVPCASADKKAFYLKRIECGSISLDNPPLEHKRTRARSYGGGN